MDFTTLPYEVQFKYLAKLPVEDVLNYCRSSSVTQSICRTKSFWKYKARKTFGIDLDVDLHFDNGWDDITQYQSIEYLYNNDQELLIKYLVRGRHITSLPSLIDRNPENFSIMLNEVEKEIKFLMQESRDPFIEQKAVDLLDRVYIIFERQIKDRANKPTVNIICSALYTLALSHNKLDLIRSISHYCIPSVHEAADIVGEAEENLGKPLDRSTIDVLKSIGFPYP